MATTYDFIGDGYDTTRRADPEIVTTLGALLNIQGDNRYLDVACGTGNYTSALSRIGGEWHAFDGSEKMLAEARPKSNRVSWSQFDVAATGYDAACFDGAICSLAIHHFPDLTAAFDEIARVLKPRARLVIFTATPDQMRTYWLTHYFPEMMERSCLQMPTLEVIDKAMQRCRLSISSTQPFYISPTLQDFFLYSGKQRPAIYLAEDVRRGISSFHNFCTDAELESGLSKLACDIESGEISAVIDNCHSALGDYLFVCANGSE